MRIKIIDPVRLDGEDLEVGSSHEVPAKIGAELIASGAAEKTETKSEKDSREKAEKADRERAEREAAELAAKADKDRQDREAAEIAEQQRLAAAGGNGGTGS